MALQCERQHQVAKYTMESAQQQGLNRYPSWYARYLLAFNNQLKCRERVQNLRHRLISEEQRYLDQASNRVRDFVLAGKHTVRPLVGDSLPRGQPALSHPLTTKSLPTKLPLLRPRQGQALSEDERGKHYDVTYPRRRRKRKTPSPQYPTFCFEELVVRAEAEKRREARRKKNIPPAAIAMPTNQDKQTGWPGDVSLTLVDYQQSSKTHDLSDDRTGVGLRGTLITRASREDPRHQNISASLLPIKLPPLEPTQITTLTSSPSVNVHTAQVRNSDSHKYPSTNTDPTAAVARHAIGFPQPSPDQAIPSDHYIPPTTSPASVADELKTKDVVISNQDSMPSLDTEDNDLLLPKEPILLENRDSSVAPTPSETTSLPTEDRKRLKRKEYQRKHLRQLKRNSISFSNENKETISNLMEHSSTQDSDFSEIEAVRRWQMIGEEGEQKMDDVTEAVNTGDVVISSQRSLPNLDTGSIVEDNDSLPPKELILLENGDSLTAPTPSETTSLPCIPADDRKRLKRKEYQRKHLRQLKRNSISFSNENKETINNLIEDSHPSPTQNGDFSEIEAVRRWQMIGEEGEQRMDDVL